MMQTFLRFSLQDRQDRLPRRALGLSVIGKAAELALFPEDTGIAVVLCVVVLLFLLLEGCLHLLFCLCGNGDAEKP